MPAFTGTTEKSHVPIKNHRYQIPEYPFDGPMPTDAEPVRGTGMAKPWTRVSTLLDTHEDKEGLIHWNARLVAKGIGDRPDLYALAASTRLEDKSGLRNVCTQAFDHAKGQASANLGTALHNFLERVLDGEKDVQIPDPWRADIAAVLAKFQEHGIQVAGGHQELVIVRPDLKDGDAAGLAGRTDLFVQMPNEVTGEMELVPADYKTGADPLAYGAWKIEQQIGIYGSAWATWDGTFWRPMPAGLRRDKVLMIHVRPGTGEVEIYVNYLNPERLEADLRAAYRTRARRRAAKKAWSVLGAETPAPVQEETHRTIGEAGDVIRTSAVLGRGHEDYVPTVPEVMAQMAEGFNSGAAKVADSITKALAPLAGPGERGCSVCRRKGHRKGSPVCLGDQDPAITGEDIDPNPMPLPGEPEPEWCLRTGPCSAPGVGWTAPEQSGDPWVCGNCGKPSRSGQINGTGVPVTGTTGMPDGPTERLYAELDREEEAANGPERACCGTLEGWPHRPDCATAAAMAQKSEETQEKNGVSQEPEVDADGDPITDDDDLFEDEDISGANTREKFLSRIAEAKDKATLRTIREEARTLGLWDAELVAAGVERVKTL